jgi:hypothetical protein
MVRGMESFYRDTGFGAQDSELAIRFSNPNLWASINIGGWEKKPVFRVKSESIAPIPAP